MKNVMKVLWGVAMVGGCAVEPEEGETAQAATTVTVSHSTMIGNGADLMVNEPYAYVFMGVFASGNGPSRVTSLWYGDAAFSSDMLSYEYTYLLGTIPNADAELGQRDASVHTTGDGLYGEKCRYDFTTNVFSCEAFVPTGSITVTWHADNLASGSFTGTSIYTNGKYSFRSQGSQHSISAQVQGSILGRTIDAGGSLSDSRGTIVNKDVILTP